MRGDRVITNARDPRWNGAWNEKDLSMEVTGGRIAVVMALGRSKAPEISVSGSGPKAKVMVGRRTVLFDGQKLVLGERQ